MVFRVGDDSMLEKLTEGAQIEFVAERVDGKLTVTRIKWRSEKLGWRKQL
jgi:Cu/Ag efflux protein CusF